MKPFFLVLLFFFFFFFSNHREANPFRIPVFSSHTHTNTL